MVEDFYDCRRRCQPSTTGDDRLGIPFSLKPIIRYAWDGKRLFTGEVDAPELFHDIAHWQIASPVRRKHPEFGLGPGPDSTAPVLQLVSNDVAAQEEEMASLLGIAYMAAFNLNFSRNLDAHGWYDNDLDVYSFWPTIVELTKRRLLTRHIPTALLDAGMLEA